MREVMNSPKLKMQLVLTGSHLLKEFGETKKVIQKDGFKIDAVVPIFDDGAPDDGATMVKAMGEALIAMPKIFKKLKPDLIFAGFDLGANLAAAITGMHMNIHVSHIQGGEVSGTVDEVLRHALTKFSHIHFAATKASRDRIIKMGENPKYVFLVGSPSLDTIKKTAYLPKQKIFKKYSIDPEKKLVVFLQHPVTTEINNVVKQIKQSLNALKKTAQRKDVQVLAIYSNNDAGGKRIIKNLLKSGIKVVPHIVYEDFLNLLKYAHALVGNSSTGIHEAPSFGLPTVNIGTRQQHRERGINVIDAKNNSGEIFSAIKNCLDNSKFRTKVKNGHNPYDHGITAKKIVKILETVKFPSIQKVITY